MLCLASLSFNLLLLSSVQGEGHHGTRDDKLAEFINPFLRQCLSFNCKIRLTDGKVFYVLKLNLRIDKGKLPMRMKKLMIFTSFSKTRNIHEVCRIGEVGI